MSGLPFTADPALAQTIRQGIREHVAALNARDTQLADQLDRMADQQQAMAAELRGRALRIAA